MVEIFENKFRNNNLDKHILNILYDSKYPTQSIIKKDLEYVSTNFYLEGFDLWEEIRGFHFYTLMVQRKALREGSLASFFLLSHQGAFIYHYNFCEKTLRVKN